MRRYANNDCNSIRLRFWQEELWNEFTKLCPEAPRDIQLIAESMLWCDAHNCALEFLPSVKLSDVRETPELISYCSNQCPFGFGFWTVSCPECVNNLECWIAAHPDDCRVLRRTTTLREYTDGCPYRDDPKFLRAMISAQLAIDGSFRDDDEIWEWDVGRGITGLAIVRDGAIKTSWTAPLEW